MSKSRARFLAELLNSDGLVKPTASALAGGDGVIDLEVLPILPNSQLEHSSISIAGHTLSLGGSLSLDTSDISENASYLYYTDGRVGSYLTTNSYATQSYVTTAVSNLVDSAPATLDTLNELAAALGDDPNFATTVTNSIGLKAPIASPTFTGTTTIPTADINAGTIDGTVIGGSTAAAGSFTTGQFNTSVNVDGTVTADGLTVDGTTDATEELARFGNNAGTQELIIEQQGSSGYAIKSSTDLRLHADYDDDTSDGASSIEMYTDGTQRMSITGSTGDISFYEDTGTNARIFYDASTQFVVNEDSADFDFRVESDSNAHMLFVDAGNNKIGINNSSPASMLDVIESNNVKSHVSARYNTANRKIGFNVDNSNGQGFLASNANQVSASAAATYDIANKAAKVDFQNGIELMTAVSGLAGATISYVNNLAVNPTTAVFNEGGADIDFRVESDTNTHALFVDAGNNRIGINSSAPNNILEINAGSTGGVTFPLSVRNSLGSFNGRGAGIEFRGSGTNVDASMFNFIDSTLKTFFYQADGHRFRTITTPNVEMLRLGTAGSSSVFNEGSADIDFRVESDGNTHALFVDAGKNKVVFGGSGSPAINAGSTRTYDAVATTGIALGSATFTHGYIGNNGVAGDVYIVSNAYPANIGTTRSIRFAGGTAFGSFRDNMLTITPDSGTVFNEDSADLDFRVESDGQSHMLFVDAGNNRLGVQESSPDTLVHINSAYDEAIRLEDVRTSISGTYDSYIGFKTFYAVTAKLGITHNDYNTANRRFFLDFTGNNTPTYHERFGVSTTETVFNEDGANLDFRVESDNNANMLFIDANTNILFIGKNSTSAVENGHQFNESGLYTATCNFTGLNEQAIFNQRDGTATTQIDFRNGNAARGYIEWTTSGTTYNTVSDRRMKENIADADDSGSSIDAIQVRKFDYINSGTHQPYGMIAQELKSIVPDAVSGSEDSEKMMAVDYSRLVPMLIKEIQSLRTRVAQLENT